MNKSDYRAMLDKIKCSDEFRSKMEEKLSAPQAEYHEYDNRVTHLERAPKYNIGRITAAAASLLLIGGIAGTAVYINTNKFHNPPASEISKITGNEFPCTALKENIPDFYSSAVIFYGNYSSIIVPEKKLNIQLVEEIVDYFCGLEWENVDIPEKNFDDEKRILLHFLCKDDSFRPLDAYSFYIYDDNTVRLEIDYEDPETGSSYSAEICMYQFSPGFYNDIKTLIESELYTQSEDNEFVDFEIISKMLDDNIVYDENINEINFRPGDGQYDPSINFSFSNEDRFNFRENLKRYAWVVSDEDFDYTNFYIMGGSLLINEDGVIHTDSGNYKPSDEKYTEEIIADLKAAFEVDEIAWLQRRIYEGSKSFSSLEADIDIFCYIPEYDSIIEEAYRIESSGKIYLSNPHYLISLEGKTFGSEYTRNVSITCSDKGGHYYERDNVTGFAISSSGKSIEKYLDYTQIYRDAVNCLRIFAEENDNMEGFTADTNSNTGNTIYTIKSDDGFKSMTLTLNEKGQIITFEFFEDDMNHTVFHIYNYKFDSPDFKIPDYTVENLN